MCTTPISHGLTNLKFSERAAQKKKNETQQSTGKILFNRKMATINEMFWVEKKNLRNLKLFSHCNKTPFSLNGGRSLWTWCLLLLAARLSATRPKRPPVDYHCVSGVYSMPCIALRWALRLPLLLSTLPHSLHSAYELFFLLWTRAMWFRTYCSFLNHLSQASWGHLKVS